MNKRYSINSSCKIPKKRLHRKGAKLNKDEVVQILELEGKIKLEKKMEYYIGCGGKVCLFYMNPTIF